MTGAGPRGPAHWVAAGGPSSDGQAQCQPRPATVRPAARPKEACHAVSVVVVGLEHHGVPLDLLERVAVSGAERAEVLAGLRARENLSEVVVLSTCLRTEVYAVVDRFHDAVFQLQEFFAKRAEIAVEDLESLVHGPLRRRRGDAPVRGGGRPRVGGARGVRGARPGPAGLGALPRASTRRARS